MLKAPFPWFGGKSHVAAEIWRYFGPINNYIEPFCGSAAVLLSRPNPTGIENINDADGWIANFWRSVRLFPDEVAGWADYPVSEVDLIARHRWLSQQDFIEKLKDDPDYCDPKLAGWWVWGQCAWIGGGWCLQNVASQKLPTIGERGKGINRKNMNLAEGQSRLSYIKSQMTLLSARLRNVRIACGDWSRLLTPSARGAYQLNWNTGIFLDPPYQDKEHSVSYVGGGNVWDEVCRWCEENDKHPKLRIILCGYQGTWKTPVGWEEVAYSKHPGYGNRGEKGRANAKRETVWISPDPERNLSLFSWSEQQEGKD